MAIYFMDWETDQSNEKDYFGDIIEYSCLDRHGLIISSSEIVWPINKGDCAVVWSNWHIIYLAKMFPDLYDRCYGRFLVFSSIAWVNTGYRSISKITKFCTGREHKGNSLQDTKDLLDSFNYCVGEFVWEEY